MPVQASLNLNIDKIVKVTPVDITVKVNVE
jgi:hypothetical protein